MFSGGSPPPKPEQPRQSQPLSPFTGEPISAPGPVLAVKIDNITQARPQTGLSGADMQVANRVRTCGGRRCVMFYAWEVPDRLDQEHIAHIVFLFEDGDLIEPREYRISLVPVTLGELRDRLALAGLREVSTDFGEITDQYVVIAMAA